jgi:F-type H+-transporting ATPase subunit epsilon
MQVTILSPEKEVFKGEVKSVKVPGSAGGFEILKNHAAIVSSLNPGIIRLIDMEGKEIYFEISGGFVEVLNNVVSLLVSGIKETQG